MITKVISSRKRSILIMLMILAAVFVCESQSVKKQKQWPVITRQGDQLYEGEKVFRFFGLAAPNIQQNESQLMPDFRNRFPDEFEIRDCLGALQQMGSRATRTFSLSVYSAKDNGIPAYISARRTYNEDAFRCLDQVIALCHEYDVRLIIPIIASQSFGGIRGVDEFAALSGKEGGAFWTDPQVKDDFKHLLRFILNRKNTINGVLYKNDPAILAWQLGNEFGSYSGDRNLPDAEWSPRILAWSSEMAAYIKSIDNNHLIMEAGGADRESLINDPNIDVMSDHLYEYWSKMAGRPYDLSQLALESLEQCKGRKPLMIDEFGLASYENQQRLMETIRRTKIVGGLMWGIRSHRRDGGWYYHNEGGTNVNSFHYPGFASGFAFDEARLLNLLRSEAFLIRGIPAPEPAAPSPAPILMVKGSGFTWRGATGAAYYSIERAESPAGPWIVLATGLHDSVIADVTSFEHSADASQALILWSDESRLPGKAYFYRIRGFNTTGPSPYSETLRVPSAIARDNK